MTISLLWFHLVDSICMKLFWKKTCLTFTNMRSLPYDIESKTFSVLHSLICSHFWVIPREFFNHWIISMKNSDSLMLIHKMVIFWIYIDSGTSWNPTEKKHWLKSGENVEWKKSVYHNNRITVVFRTDIFQRLIRSQLVWK